jgi:hypothetical protein
MAESQGNTPADAPTDDPGSGDLGLVFEDAEYRLAVVDLLGAIAYGELSAFERLADDAKLAPTVRDKVEMVQMATLEFGHVGRLHARIRELGADPFEAMAPFESALDLFHVHTAPADWYEGLVKAFVGDGLAADFYREVAAVLDRGTRDLVIDSLEESGQSRFVIDRVRAAIEADHRVGGRLALWGRRLMGEALSQAQRVAADRDALTALLAGGIDRPGMDLAALSRMFARLTENHTKRMDELGLDS